MFYVNYGKLLIEIYTSKFVMETGDSFIVPGGIFKLIYFHKLMSVNIIICAGNSYKFTNLRVDEASLIFYST